jgi:cutinase
MLPSSPWLALAAFTSVSTGIPMLKRQHDGADTRDQLTSGTTPCRAITILYARGTMEPGNVGGETGQQFFRAVAETVGPQNLAVQGVSRDTPGLSVAGKLVGVGWAR